MNNASEGKLSEKRLFLEFVAISCKFLNYKDFLYKLCLAQSNGGFFIEVTQYSISVRSKKLEHIAFEVLGVQTNWGLILMEDSGRKMPYTIGLLHFESKTFYEFVLNFYDWAVFRESSKLPE